MNPTEVVENILTHTGVKGMKWGIRQRVSPTARSERRVKAAQTHFEKTVKSRDFKANLHNDTVNIMNNYHIPRINAKYAKELANGNLSDPHHPATKKYHDDVMNTYVKEANKHVSALTDVTGSKRLVVTRREPTKRDPFAFDVHIKDIKHADATFYIVKVILDSNGLVIDFELVDNALIQGTLIVGNILAHTGVKGMKWGVRRKATVGAQEVIISDKRIGKGIKTSGGKGHPASSEAISARKIGQVGKKSGITSLSNKQLQEYNNRLNLELQAKRLTFQDQSAAKRFIKTLMGRKIGPGIEAGGKVALKSTYARKKIATGAAALALM